MVGFNITGALNNDSKGRPFPFVAKGLFFRGFRSSFQGGIYNFKVCDVKFLTSSIHGKLVAWDFRGIPISLSNNPFHIHKEIPGIQTTGPQTTNFYH